MSEIPNKQGHTDASRTALGAMEAFGMQDTTSEEQPAMRSVACMPAGAPTKLTPLSSAAGPNFGKIGLARPKGGLKQQVSTRQSFTVTQEWTGTVDAGTWDVKTEDLESVPTDFPLERTHREIYSDAAEVSKRISEALQKMSIDATYEKAKAKCKTTEDCVKFRIRLYAGGGDGQPLVVEVQKRSGPTSAFMRSCRAVLDAAEGCNTENDSSKKSFSPPTTMDLSKMECLQSVEVPGPSPERQSRMAFESASALLKSGKHDSVVLGLQSLCNLTDPLKTSPANAIRVSKWILAGELDLRENVLSCLKLKLEDEEEDLALAFEQQKHYALVVIANSLEMCVTEGCLGNNMMEQPFEAELIPALFEVLRDANNSASNAYTACRSIYSLLSGSVVSLEAHLNDLKMLLQEAQVIGLQAHDLLARETRRCLGALTKNECP